MLEDDWQSNPSPPPVSPLTLATKVYVVHHSLTLMQVFRFCRSIMSASELIVDHRRRVLPLSDEVRVCLMIQRKHVFDHAVHKAEWP